MIGSSWIHVRGGIVFVVIMLCIGFLRFPSLMGGQVYAVPPSSTTPPTPNLSVRDFGAIPNDGRDHTAEIQSAIDEALNGTVKTIVFPPGQYILTSVNVAPGLTLWGYGVTLKFPPLQPNWVRMFDTENPGYLYSDVVDSPPLIIKGFVFDGNRLNQGPYKNYQLEHQAELFLTADPANPGRLVVQLQDITFQEGAGDGVDVFRNVNVAMQRISATNIFREGIGIGGGNNVVNLDSFTSGGTEEYTGFHVEMAPGAGPNIMTVSNCQLLQNFSVALIDGSTLSATNVVSGSPWSVAAGDTSKVTISNSTLGGGQDFDNSNIINPGNVLFENVDFYSNDLQAAPSGPVAAIARVLMNNQTSSFTHQRLRFDNCRFHLPRTGKPSWMTAAISDGGDITARDNRIIMRNSTIDPGFSYGFYGSMGGIWDIADSEIAAAKALHLSYSLINGVKYFWDVVLQCITPSNYVIEYANQQPPDIEFVTALKITSPTSGALVSGSTLISYNGSAPTPQCSLDGGTWTACISGQTAFGQLPAWNNIPVGTTFSLYLRDQLGGTDVMQGLRRLANPPVADAVPASLSVRLVSPALDSVFQAGNSVALVARATARGSRIRSVEFFQNGVSLGSGALRLDGSYVFNWSSSSAGTYYLSAKVTDDIGASASSCVVNVSVDE